MKKNIALAKYTTTQIGGPARYFCQAKTEADLIDCVEKAGEFQVPYLVIGRGSNLLINDSGFNGMVIHNQVDGIKQSDGEMIVKTGTQLSKLVKLAVEQGYQGLEKLAGIPGTVGGAIYGNAGAYGQAISDYLVRVKAFDGQKTIWLTKKDCEFAYRESIFKKKNFILLEAEFELPKGSKEELEKEMQRVIAERVEKYPPGILCPGSFFKNIEVKNLNLEQLKLIPKDKIIFGKVPAGYLLEAVGAKGMKQGKIQVADYHGNLIINTGGGCASDFYKLTQVLQDKVKAKFGIDLEPEVQLVGFSKRVAILGYGLEGQDAEKFFQAQGIQITILDQKFDPDYLKKLDQFDVIVRSPGVYRYLPEIMAAQKAGAEITSAIKIFFAKCPAKIIGVTGTKGKGTTSTLIYEILKKADKDVYLVGNIGKPYLEILSKLNADSFVVMEISSFQLIDMDISPHIAVVLNITLDHMDWHKDRTEYVSSKKNIVKYQSASDWAIVNSDYETSKSFAEETKAKVIYFSKGGLELKYKTNLLLRGEHNQENIAAAVAVCKILKIKDEVSLEVLAKFRGLEHRLELVGEINGVAFYNDSFATGPQPTIAAIKSFNEPITLILGGSDKGLNYDELGDEVVRQKQVKKVIIIGKIGPMIIRSLNLAKFHGSIINLKQKPMAKIVQNAFRNTPKGGVVLLSPAAASFDMFANYKDRGNQFKKAVNLLR